MYFLATSLIKIFLKSSAVEAPPILPPPPPLLDSMLFDEFVLRTILTVSPLKPLL
jgi:hypothetical protein